MNHERNNLINSYLAGGYTLFPLTRRKTPRHSGWRKTVFDPLLDPDELPEAYGVLLQPDDLIIDYDTKREEKDRNQLKELWANLGLPSAETFVVKTVNNGYQLYFKKPSNLIIKGNCRLPEYPAIDIKKVGGYVVGAGSEVFNKDDEMFPYTVTRGQPEDIMQAAQPLLNYLAKLVITNPSDNHDFKDVNDEGTKFQYTRFLLDVKPAISGSNGNDHTYFVACKGRDLGLSEDIVIEMMLEFFNGRCKPPWENSDIQKIVAHAYSYAQNKIGQRHVANDFSGEKFDEYKDEPVLGGWDRAKDHTLLPTLHNTANFFKMKHVTVGGVDADETHKVKNPLYNMLRYNLFTERAEFEHKAPWHKIGNKVNWDDNDTRLFRYWLSTNQHFNVSKDICDDTAYIIAHQRSYHPIKDYLENIRWDGVPRLDRLLTVYCGASDEPWIHELSKNTFIAACARIYKPGCKHDHILILEGETQGKGKSTFIEIMGGTYAKSFNVLAKEKDTIAYMRGAWLIEMAEMATLNLDEVEAMKAFITRSVDTVRLSYDRFEGDRARQSIFIGTTNHTAATPYLKDKTGNRRFWTVETGIIELAKLRRDRDQLWAEAFFRYNQGEPWWITDENIESQVRKEQAKRLETDTWEETIAGYLAELRFNMEEHEMPVLTTSHILQHALFMPLSRVKRSEQLRVSLIMRKLGYKSETRYDKRDERAYRSWILDTGV